MSSELSRNLEVCLSLLYRFDKLNLGKGVKSLNLTLFSSFCLVGMNLAILYTCSLNPYRVSGTLAIILILLLPLVLLGTVFLRFSEKGRFRDSTLKEFAGLLHG